MSATREAANEFVREAARQNKVSISEKGDLLLLISELPPKGGQPDLFDGMDMQDMLDILRARLSKKQQQQQLQSGSFNSIRLDYPHMSPAARDLLKKSTVIFKERSTDTEGAEQVTGCGLGFFVSPQVVVSCQHNFAGFHTNDEVEAWLPQGGGFKEIKLRILELDKERDIAKLQTDPHSTHVCLCKLDPSTLKGRSVASGLYQLELQKELKGFDLELMTMTAIILRASRDKPFFTYECKSWDGDSGAAIVTYDGDVVGMHLQSVDAVKEILDQQMSVDDRLDDLSKSVKSLIKSTAQGGFGLLASHF